MKHYQAERRVYFGSWHAGVQFLGYGKSPEVREWLIKKGPIF
jgi:hypothetical protein